MPALSSNSAVTSLDCPIAKTG